MELKNLLSKSQIKEISSVISKAEMLTSGEIRLHLEEVCGGNVEARALEVFYKLKMNKTVLGKLRFYWFNFFAILRDLNK